MRRILMHPRIRRIIFFFPFQLLFLHLKKNLLLLSVWGLLFGFVTQALAPRYGVPYLFLNPEYLDEVSPLSYFILGFACGGFTMAFNIASYILNSFRFPFLATLSHPFTKYCINNYIIPGLFLFVYVGCTIAFLRAELVYSSFEIFTFVGGFLGGFTIFVVITLLYFFRTNKDIHRMFGVKPQEAKDEQILRKRIRKSDSWKNPLLIHESRDWYVETYLSNLFRVRLVRAVRHYKREMLRNVFRQNHRNAGIFSFISIISLLAMGFFREVPFLMIPAGASVFLLLTMLIMLPVPLHSIFKGWAPVILLFFLVLLNFLYRFDIFNNINKAYGLNYDTQKAVFDNKRLNEFALQKDTSDADFKNMIEVLNKWRLKNLKTSLEKNEKPKFVIVCTSGGGLRSSLWTLHSLQYADSLLQGELMKHIALFTGSSGGMIGAAYLRERYWQSQSGKANLYDKSYLTDVSKDVLNSVAFSIATSDWFLSFQKAKFDGHRYTKDRGYMFEKRLNDNLQHVFGEKRLCDYKLVESEAIVPMMIFSPTIVNDGRKLIVSSLPVSFLTRSADKENLRVAPLNDGIEFSRFFRGQNAGNIFFTSVLRMSSTFPYITPIVSLPSEPAIEIMDAGMRDNYGIEVALKYLYVFKNWIETNTSGVVIIQIRDRHKEFPVEENTAPTIMGAITRPLGSFYGNLFYMQDFTQSQEIEYISSWFNGQIDIVDFQLKNEIPDKISLSWHLTNREKLKVIASIDLPENKEAINRLRKLLE